MLRELGVDLQREVSDDGSCTVRLEPAARLAPFTFDVPGDFSSAAFILAFAAMRAPEPVRIAGAGLNPGRTGLLDVLRRMGATPQLENERTSCGEPIGDIVMARADLAATDIAGSEVPALIDEIPVIAVLAARARGTTTVRGAGELRVKESDRIAAVVNNLRAIGVRAEELADGMVIEGTDAPLAGRVATLHDHRIAMAFGLLAAEPGARIGIDDPAIVGVSFPDFWTTLDALQAR
jgi:3-phosphoshikimate 1-carboxyvinyltransferase